MNSVVHAMSGEGGMKKFLVCSGQPSLVIPVAYLDYCIENKYPAIIIWRRMRFADIALLNEPYQMSHCGLFSRQDFRCDIEQRAETIYQQHATAMTSRAITFSLMRFYNLDIECVESAASQLFDMTLNIINQYSRQE
ncbi:TPA: hypothetical protein MYL57_005840 [Klebsiella variicola subsp. variicola]|uniref:hypothetical protein n=1 Tax=Klebsiella variicola TaxID=244366 RepID=UPI00190E6E87|nr:hypothetical protein [Klebsiella variicola]HCB0645728.1 hypothetical protein [Klebsiella variicola subsp. variicola]